MAGRKFTPNAHRVEGETAVVALKSGHETRIDLADLGRVLSHSWNAYEFRAGVWYVKSTTGGYLHRLITNAPTGRKVDHRNHDSLDNRRENLRVVTNKENVENRRGANPNSQTGVRGVYPHRCKPSGMMYGAKVTKGKRQWVKYFPYTPEGLAQASAAVVEMRRELMTHSDGR